MSLRLRTLPTLRLCETRTRRRRTHGSWTCRSGRCTKWRHEPHQSNAPSRPDDCVRHFNQHTLKCLPSLVSHYLSFYFSPFPLPLSFSLSHTHTHTHTKGTINCFISNRDSLTFISLAVQFLGMPLIQSFWLSTDWVTPKNLLGLKWKRMCQT